MENFGKNCNVRGRWEFVSLDKEEIEKALEELRESNYEQLNKIKQMTNDMETIKMLADKNLLAAYTYLSSVLDRKIEAKKNPQPAQDITQNPMYKKAEHYAGLKLQGKSEPTGEPSLIDKAMEHKDK